MFFGDTFGLRACDIAQKRIDDADSVPKCKKVTIPKNAISTDVPATEEEIAKSGMYERKENESLLSYIKRSCVWCARSKGKNRSLLEFLVRSQGIWLHAFQYSVMGPCGKMTYKTNPPDWSEFS